MLPYTLNTMLETLLVDEFEGCFYSVFPRHSACLSLLFTTLAVEKAVGKCLAVLECAVTA
jgi:hypothetical protein